MLRSGVYLNNVILRTLKETQMPERIEPLEPEEQPTQQLCQDCGTEMVPYDDGRGFYCPRCGTD